MSFLKSFFLSLLLLAPLKATEIDEANIYVRIYRENSSLTPRDIATLMLPQKEAPYSYEDFAAPYLPFLHQDLVDDFQRGWQAIFASGTERRPVVKETGHMQCLLGRLLGNWVSFQGDKNMAEFLENQRNNLYGNFEIPAHMTAIKAADAGLHSKITRHLAPPCSSCKSSSSL